MTKDLRSYNVEWLPGHKATETACTPAGKTIAEKAPADWAHSKSWREGYACFGTTEGQRLLTSSPTFQEAVGAAFRYRLTPLIPGGGAPPRAPLKWFYDFNAKLKTTNPTKDTDL